MQLNKLLLFKKYQPNTHRDISQNNKASPKSKPYVSTLFNNFQNYLFQGNKVNGKNENTVHVLGKLSTF